MSRRLSESEKVLLKQLIITCELRDLTEKESLSYIKRKIGRQISRRTFYQIKSKLYDEKILKKTESFLPLMGFGSFLKSRSLFPEKRYLNVENECSKNYTHTNNLDFIPEHTYKIFSQADDLIIRSRNFFARLNNLKETSTKNYESVPSNATIRKEYVKCGNYSCYRCKHGPYYYAYWRDETGKLRKKYLGKHDPRDNDTLNLIDLTKLRTSFEL